MRGHLFSCLVLSITTLAACGSAGSGAEDGDAAVAAEAIDAADVTQTEAALVISTASGAGAAQTAEDAASAAAATAPTLYQPASCVTTTVKGATVTYALDGCSGPYGLADVSGTLTVAYGISVAGIQVTVVGTGLSARGAELDLSVNATYAQSGTAGSLTATTEGSGKGPLGTSASRAGSYKATWDEGTMCVGLDGAWSTNGSGARKWSTTVSGLESCAGKCPASGGKIVYEGGIAGTSVTIDFAGGASASWSTPAGKSGEITLPCDGGA